MITMNGSTTAGAKSAHDREANIGGLCANCANLRTCSYASPVNDTWFCEEYIFEKSETTGLLGEPLPVMNNIASSRTGLCTNCESREGCTFPQPPGGVWFCGEYR